MNIYETHCMKDPLLPFIFHKAICLSPKNDFPFGNWHENIELLHILSGKGKITYDTVSISVSAGDTVVVNPNCFHAVFATEQDLTYHCLIIDRSFCLANGLDTNTTRFERYIKDPTIQERLCSLAEAFPLSEPLGVADVLSVRTDILAILERLCRLYSSPEYNENRESRLLSCVKQAIGLIRSESGRDLSLDEAADFVGLSKFYFARAFRQITGYTFVAYVNMTRCEHAKQLLHESDLTIGEICRVCGFSNKSYFTRTFQSFIGCLPSEYRKAKPAQKQTD